LKEHVIRHLEEVLRIPGAERLKQRYRKFRSFGPFEERKGGASGTPAKAPAV